MLAQVVVAASGDAFQLAPAEGELELDVAGTARVVSQLVRVVGPQAQFLGWEAVALEPLRALLHPELKPLLVVARLHKELHLHLLEFAGPKQEVPGGDLVAKGLADLRDAEGQPTAGRLLHVLEIHEDRLRGFRPQVGYRRVLLHRPHEGLEHRVELPRLAQFLLPAHRALLRVGQVVRPKASPAVPAFDQRVRKMVYMPRRLPHFRRHQDRGVQPHHVVVRQHYVPPPGFLDVANQLCPQRPVVPGTAEATVDFRAREHIAAPFRQRDQLFHCVVLCHAVLSGARRGAG